MPDLLASRSTVAAAIWMARVEGGQVWMACDCGADIVQPVQPTEPAWPDG